MAKPPTERIQEVSFQKGDRVTAFGNKGTVKSISENGMFVIVEFDEVPTTVVFTIDGKIHNWNKRPSLKKVRRK